MLTSRHIIILNGLHVYAHHYLFHMLKPRGTKVADLISPDLSLYCHGSLDRLIHTIKSVVVGVDLGKQKETGGTEWSDCDLVHLYTI